MSAYKSEFLNILAERGFIHQVSEPEALDARAKAGPITAYIGFDCTAASLHVGSLLPIMMLYWMQQTGHRPIALMGGGTTRVGDPRGKDESRRILTDAQINENLAGIRAVFAKFLKFESDGGSAIMANNADWLNTLNYIDFLRDVGRHFSVNRMLSFDSVKMRLDRQQELSFLEFNYMVLQAYDFVELYKRTGCILQMGGSDQWGNIVNGIDLGRRMENAQLFALTSPLITTSSGAKMGKTAAGAVWLNADLVSPLRLLAVLAQHRGRRRRALPQAVHGAAARRDRQARRAARRGDQRGQEGAGDRSDRPGARPRSRRTRPPTPRAAPSRKARSPRTCRRSRSPAPISTLGSACSRRLRRRPSSSPPTATRAGRSRRAG